MMKAQGALEYLLLIGGSIVVAAIVLALIFNLGQSENDWKKEALIKTEIKKMGLLGIKLVARYKLDGDTTDSSGNGLDGTLANPYAPPFTSSYKKGTLYRAIDVSNSVDYVRRPASMSIDSDPILTAMQSITLSAMINTADNASTQMLVTKYYEPPENGEWMLYLLNGAVHFTVITDVAGALTHTECTKLTPTNYGDGRWHHIAATYDGTTTKIFYDGIKLKECPVPGGGPFRARKALAVMIGKYARGVSEEGFNGKIDDVMIFDKALPEEEMRALYYIYRA